MKHGCYGYAMTVNNLVQNNEIFQKPIHAPTINLDSGHKFGHLHIIVTFYNNMSRILKMTSIKSSVIKCHTIKNQRMKNN